MLNVTKNKMVRSIKITKNSCLILCKYMYKKLSETWSILSTSYRRYMTFTSFHLSLRCISLPKYWFNLVIMLTQLHNL